MDNIKKRQQLSAQCNAVWYLASQIASLHVELSDYYQHANVSLVNAAGVRTARLMNNLGDVLNAMDAVTEDDSFLDEVFENALLYFPDESDKSNE